MLMLLHTNTHLSKRAITQRLAQSVIGQEECWGLVHRLMLFCNPILRSIRHRLLG